MGGVDASELPAPPIVLDVSALLGDDSRSISGSDDVSRARSEKPLEPSSLFAAVDAVVSVAAVIEQAGDEITAARIAWGGVGSVPWRAHAAEQVLVGQPATAAVFERAAGTELTDAFTVPGTAFKVELARRAMIRQLTLLAGSAR